MSKRKALPKRVRDQVYERHCNGKYHSLCFCCRSIQISPANFECGHVIAHTKGGSDELDNLRAICSACNRSMGTMNMDKFINRYGFHKTEKIKINTIKPKIKPKNTLKDIIKCIFIINGNLPLHYKDYITNECKNYQHVYECQLGGETPYQTISRTLTQNKDCFVRTEPGTYKLKEEYIQNDSDYHKKVKMALSFIRHVLW